MSSINISIAKRSGGIVLAAVAVLVLVVLAPPAAKADPGTLTEAQIYLNSFNQTTIDITMSPLQYADSLTAQTDYARAIAAASMGDFSAAIADLDGVNKALGFPPDSGSAPAPEPSGAMLLICGLLGLTVVVSRKLSAPR